MKFKLDENASPAWGAPLARQGHDVTTVVEESLEGAEDAAVAEACRSEGRCLITADLDFAQILDFPPERYLGLIVLRHPRPTIRGMSALVEQVAAAVS